MNTATKPPVVLIVEDEALVRMLAWDTLSDEGGYRVIEAMNADEALILLEARPDVRVVFTDVNMPGSLNGYGLARIVDMRWPGIGIIVTSGATKPGPGDLPKQARFVDKPHSPSTLLRLMQEVLSEAAPIDRQAPLQQVRSTLSAGIMLHQPDMSGERNS